MRLNKYLAQKGLCSRREADVLIQKGLVLVNSKVPKTLGFMVQEGDQVEVKTEAYILLKQKITIVLNKPLGFVSGPREKNYKSAVSLIKKENFYGSTTKPLFIPCKGLAPLGRLDVDSTGLLVLSQDGSLARQIISPQSKVEKEYQVQVKGLVDLKKIEKLSSGLKLDGKPLRPAQVQMTSPQNLNFILTEGKKRQIRRMCELVDLEVIGLKRVRIGAISLGKLPQGKWKYLRTKSLRNRL